MPVVKSVLAKRRISKLSFSLICASCETRGLGSLTCVIFKEKTYQIISGIPSHKYNNRQLLYGSLEELLLKIGSNADYGTLTFKLLFIGFNHVDGNMAPFIRKPIHNFS